MITLLSPLRFLRSRVIFATALFALVAPAALHAQVENRKPKEESEVSEKIKASGLKPEEIRAKLKASGYKEDMLDAYLAGGNPGGANTPPPTKDVLDAVGALGANARAEQAASSQKAIRNAEAATSPTAENGMPVFGLEIFRNASTQFDPNVAGPVDKNYRIGPNDVLAIILTGEVELSHSLEVTRDGFVIIPQVGQVFVSNMTLEMATRAIIQKLNKSYSNVSTDANTATHAYVSVARVRVNQVFVIGDVASAGSYQIPAAGTAMTALYAAGGPTLNGTLRRVEVRRANQVVSTLDVYDYLLKGDASRDIRLENGDIIFVSTHSKRVSVTGEIRRAALYDLKDGEKLADLIVAAGGLKASANSSRVQIERILPPSQRREGRDRALFDVSMDPESNELAKFQLQDGDRVRILGVVDRVRDRVEVKGTAWTPGYVAFRPGMRLSQAIKQAGGARPDTYRNQVLVNRLQPDESHTQIRATIDSVNNFVPDVLLQDGDEITLFAAPDFQTSRDVYLVGAVRRPTKTVFAQGMTLTDLLTMAGGIESNTDAMDSITVSRLGDDMNRSIVSVPLRMNGAFNGFELKGGDSIKVYARSSFRPDRIVTVGGDVKGDVKEVVVKDSNGVVKKVSHLQNPTLRQAIEIPFQQGLTLRQAILAAGGLQESALLTEVEVSRFPTDRKDGKLATVFRVPIDSTYLFERGSNGAYMGPPGIAGTTAKAAEFVLQPYDQINVLRQPDWEKPGSIFLGGEVKYPGEYAIKNRGETISDVIARAGGLTERAYPDGVDFRRRIDSDDRLERQRLLDRVRRERAYTMSVERVQASAAKTTVESGAAVGDAVRTEEEALAAILQGETELSERIGIDLPQVLRNKSHRDNLKLKAGDKIIIPAYTPTVTVRGFVNSPNAVLFRPGQNLKYYVNAAGGASANGDIARAFVQQPNGEIEALVPHRLAPDHVPVPRAGAIIVVPAVNPKIESGNSGSAIAAISALAGIAMAAASLIQISK